ncbi:MAG: glycosyltransferase [Acidobacteriia bacterium]|nr:glycosyltransferase [Terriglobia bacterium]
MRVACFTPLPPCPSGIADYSAALIEPLSRLCQLQVFPRDGRFDPAAFDLALYQIGNNPYHAGAYQQALETPGVVVLHEANLHHLIAEITIRRGDWDGYLREVEHDGGAAALEFAQSVRRLEVGPDYDGVPMLGRLMQSARGVIAHSDFVLAAARAAGFQGPTARIPHGAWVGAGAPMPDRIGFRRKLGIDESTPLIGIFGHLKPYKRIAESLRAFRRLVRLNGRVRLILVGEPHQELRLDSMIRSLDLSAAVRLVGRTEIEDFTGYLSACDIVLNLRYPTVGETSGTLLRAMSLGKAVLVSDVGAFSEFPDQACLKVPVGAGEEDILFEYLQLLVERPDLEAALGRQAQAWVERDCGWSSAAAHYHSFLRSVAEGTEWTQPARVSEMAVVETVAVDPGYIRGWAGAAPAGQSYVETHITRLSKTLELIPKGTAEDRILEMGAYMQITPALRQKLGYGEVRGCYYGPAGRVEHKEAVSADGERFCCAIDLFDAEKDVFPYEDGYFSAVLCCELIEHLPSDPMHMMSEINRVLKDDGYLLITTPNIGSLRAISAILQGYHPGFFPAYLRPPEDGVYTDARHNREYTPKEIHTLLSDAGFRVERLETGPFLAEPKPELLWVEDMLHRFRMPADLRGDGIYILGQKTGPVGQRYPAWLYS